MTKTSPDINPADKLKILGWLNSIEERDKEIRRDVIAKCAKSTVALAYYLGRADEPQPRRQRQ